MSGFFKTLPASWRYQKLKHVADFRVSNVDKLSNELEEPVRLSAGSKQAVRMSFEEVAQDMLHELIESNFKFYKKVQDDEEISKELFDRLFERCFAKKKS